ncbi:Stp1/IreP family PP2C-type Ser/Thr phosphatase [Cellulomonas xiejunii]|uniref:Stp1/IreP family PP2C-type Ser/Thr phosphatase n=1 Tax=Cellulomonas xiejunii TaxID=2968083 RepID=A0ABY5KN68_9CELL|nr:Stp1/IreP family PP2C-type Ser/Thr phosphatase [Cellulomonas xiejunii]MCC2313483.1 Stp1/IreP family PP2C-type Ser/Thr phosphatase [Cellulomonas xiejunii]MCC2321344.1 Stp1/IreP family PP2C-type Ser/Thr phosphatase [Cellulomonas xiejunii]UUI71929.1 Stp1/IreP family PP2C-type Ser/Thr phosphatase [Cellulomonas xiejunii]
MTVALRYAARSDVGLVRSDNQDSAYAGPHLLVVADGMGGHAGGDVASSVAVAALAPLDGESHGPDDALDELETALDDARSEIIARSDAEPDLAGMGTTVTAILRAGNKLAMVHLGDSRGYLFRDGTLTQVTTDHTFVQHLVDTGRITPEEAEHHPQRSVVMRVLGDFDSDVTADLSVREARPGDRWLLCSDGLSGYVSAETIAETLAEIEDVDACADRLVQLALRAGGPDNVTVVIADVVELDSLADGTMPSTASSVVGAAAVSRNRPSAAADGPAARAARLSRKARSEAGASDDDARDDDTDDGDAAPPSPPDDDADRSHDDEDEPLEPAPRRRGLALTWVAVGVALVAALVGAYLWTQTQYFVGAPDGTVAVYRGIPQSLGPVELASLVETSDVQVDELPAYLRERVESTISAGSLEEARRLVDMLAEGATPKPSPTPTATPTPTMTPTPGATLPAQAVDPVIPPPADPETNAGAPTLGPPAVTRTL